MAHAPVQGLGIALSGGGIRSAAFALGALQAIDQKLGDAETGTGGLRRFHYISSVSGGGYMGAAVRLGMEKNGGTFPFSTIGDRADNGAVGHIRNHSRYLIPGGLKDVIGCLVVLLRGFAVNATLVLAGLLVAAGFTGVFNPNQEAFATPDVLGWEWFPSEAWMKPLLTPLGSFAYTKLLLLLGVVGLAAWGIRRSLSRECDEFEGVWFWSLYAWLVTVAAAALFELQPFAVAGLFYSSDAAASRPVAGQSPLGAIAAALSRLSVYLAPLTAVAAVVSRFFGDAVKAGMADHSVKSMAAKAVAVLAMLFVSLALPLILWIIYLNLTLWTDVGYIGRPGWLQLIVADACGRPDIGAIDFGLSTELPPSPGLNDACRAPRLIALLFVATGAVLFAVTWLLRPNANSLHRLYRDRLSKAFLFDPMTAIANPGSEPTPCGHMRLNDLKPSTGPLPLINCALNVQGSKVVNRRGRNADFFFFSPVFTGSSATGFVRTEAVDAKNRPLIPDIGTAVAVSGAAASSNMGGNTVRGLAPTLALLNIRLGYWLENPRRLCRNAAQRSPILEKLLGLYLVAEMFSLLDERAAQVYLTDGGHIENLGLYELLRRRVKTIVVVDGEADPAYAFSSFIAAQRFARIDLGVRIDLDWSAIREASMAVDESFRAGATGQLGASARPHVAVGTIDYGHAAGVLIYVKASMTGDENDYVKAYKRAHPLFPHESTGDQFFSEEQFEVYRSLGFHAVNSAFEGKTAVAGAAPPAQNAAGAKPREGTFADHFK